MCVAIPARVTELGADATATVDLRGRLIRVALFAVDEPVQPGDWLLVHSGIAVARVDETEAVLRHRLIAQTGEPG
jgi:hydrogenase expression/formation protein HypC